MNQRRTTLKSVLVSIATLGLLAAGTAGCSSTSVGNPSTAQSPTVQSSPGSESGVNDTGRLSKPTTITVTLPARLGAFTDVLLAQEMGEFAARNLTVNVKVVKSSDALVLLAKGNVDVVLTGISANLLNAINSGIDVRLAMPEYTANPKGKTGWWVSAKALEGATFSPEMLKGKTVASSQGADGASILGLVDTLKTANLTLSDVTIKTLGSADIVTALENGAVFAGVLTEPLTVPSDKGSMFTFVTREGWPAASAVFGPTLLKDNPDAAKAFVSAVLAARKKLDGDYVNDPQRAPEIAKLLDMTVAQLQHATAFVWTTDLRYPDGYVAAYQDIWRQADLLKSPKDLSQGDVVDSTALDWAIDHR